MLKSLISGPDPEAGLPLDGLFEALSRTIPAEESLDGRILRLAEGLVDTAFINGAIVAAVGSDGETFDLASAGFADDSLRSRSFDDLDQVARDLSGLTDWSLIAMDRLIRNATDPHRAQKLLGRRLDSGLFIVASGTSSLEKELIYSLRGAEPFLSWILRDAIRIEKNRLQSEIRSAEVRILSQPNPIQVKQVVNELKKVFRADAATLLTKEQGKLYLSATTDLELHERGAVFKPGEGLTTELYKHGLSLRLRNAHDPTEISAKTKGKVKNPASVHPEAIAREGNPRLLVVPLAIGKKVRGLVRLLRREGAPPFSELEQFLLEGHARLLAIALHSSWKLIRADSILKAETEAICISSTEIKDGKPYPRLTWVDPGAVTLFGRPKQILEGSDGSSYYAVGEFERIRRFLKRALAKGKKVAGPLQTRIRTKGGIRQAKISYRLLSSPFSRPTAQYTIAVIQDVTRESRVANLLDRMNLAYFRTDTEGYTIQTSSTEQRITGYSEEALLGRHREDLYQDKSQRRWVVEQTIAKRGDFLRVEKRLKKKNGETFIAQVAIRAIFGHGGLLVGFEGLYEDITDRHSLQSYLGEGTSVLMAESDLYKKLKDNARLHMMFMTNVSHQLRAPLGALVEHMKNFKEEDTDHQVFFQRLGYAIKQAKVCSLLVSNFSYMDQLLRGEPFEFTTVNLVSLADEVENYFQHLALDKEIAIKVLNQTMNPFLGVRVHRELILQVFVNLVDNAIKYSSPGTTIRIEGSGSLGDPKGPILQISNQGLPISVDQRRTLFERGTRLPEAQLLVPGGTGLGLWLVKKILDTHQASIVCTTVKQGEIERTAFQISFPISSFDRREG